MKLNKLMYCSFVLLTSHVINAQNNTIYPLHFPVPHQGSNNTFIVDGNTGRPSNTGSDNTFFGYLSGKQNTSGSNNTFIGAASGYDNSSGDYNTFVGTSTGENSGGNSNTFIGNNAGTNSISDDNIYIGNKAGHNYALGNNNICIGSNAGINALGSNNIFIGYYAGHDITESDRLVINNSSSSTPIIYGDLSTNQIGINTTNLPSGLYEDYKLAVNGKIISSKAKALATGDWPDYVFDDDYQLKELSEVETYITSNKHLEGIPSIDEINEEGYHLEEMDALLLEKIEELTLYTIEKQKKIDVLKKKLNEL